VREERILRLEGDGEGLRRILFEDGSEIEREGMFYAPPQRQRSALVGALGCEIEAVGPLPTTVVKGDPMTSETTVPGVYVAGDAGTMRQGAIMAAASGAVAAASLNHSLIVEDAGISVPPHGGDGGTLTATR
jgi:thioredoxin reductase